MKGIIVYNSHGEVRSDELRVYFNKNRYTTIEYWFLDWFDGAFRNVTTDEDILWYVDLFNFDKTINKKE